MFFLTWGHLLAISDIRLCIYHEKVAVKAEGEMFGLRGRTNLRSFGQIFDRYICCSTLAESKIKMLEVSVENKLFSKS